MSLSPQAKQFVLWQINDSLFPIGAYSHSYGLETYIQHNLVTDEVTAGKYITNYLRYSVLYTDLLAIRLSYEYTQQGRMEAVSSLEDIMAASRLPREIREATQKLGNRFIKTLRQTALASEVTDKFIEYLRLRTGESTCHACAYGVLCADLDISKRQAIANFLYAQASALVTNCVKTIPLSQSAGQKILTSLYPLFDEILEETEQATIEDLGLSNPGFDLRSIQHEYLYSRLYMS